MSRSFLLLVLGLIVARTTAADEALGRLFYSAEQRALLDEQRKSSPAMHTGTSQPLRLDGSVSRRDGRRTLWINGQILHSPATTKAPKDAATTIATQAGPVPLRVGESVDPFSGERYRALPDGTIRIHTREKR